jgi:hypothetical protein
MELSATGEWLRLDDINQDGFRFISNNINFLSYLKAKCPICGKIDNVHIACHGGDYECRYCNSVIKLFKKDFMEGVTSYMWNLIKVEHQCVYAPKDVKILLDKHNTYVTNDEEGYDTTTWEYCPYCGKELRKGIWQT